MVTNSATSPPVFLFDDVSVELGGHDVLHDVRAIVPDRALTTIVGPSGSGKSTLLRLCNRLVAPSVGRVMFRGRDMADLDVLATGRRVGMVFQAPTLFAGTVRDNLAVAAPEGPEGPIRHNWAVYAIATFAFTLIVTRLAAGALIATGLPASIARFQARSAYSGSGFTTVEAENVVNHPVRRRVVYVLMMVGNLGTPTLVVTVVLGFVAPGPGDTMARVLGLFAALVLLLVFLSSPPLSRWLERVGRRYADRRLLGALGAEPEELLDLGDDFVVSRVPLARSPGKGAVRSLRSLRALLPDVNVLGVRQWDGAASVYRGGTPTDVELSAGDALVVHGRRDAVRRLTADQSAQRDGPAP